MKYKIKFSVLIILFFCGMMTYAQQMTINGKVSDKEGAVLPGVTVVVKGTTNGTVTDLNGNFSLSNVMPNTILVFSFIGMASKEVGVVNQTTIHIVLEDEMLGLDEVVVVGYGTQKKSDLTGSVASFNADDITKMPQVDITQSLQGRLPGLNVTFTGANAEGGKSNIRIRGENSISASNNPFIVVDGIPYYGSLSEINPTDIESVNILKDASSTAIYGARASNGVILITTKKGIEGEMKVSINSHYGISEIINLPDLQDAQTFFEMKLQRFGRDNISMTEKEGFLEGRDTDWLDLSTRLGTNQEHNLSLRGGTKKIQYFISGTFNKTEGIAKNDDFKRTSLRVSLDTQLKPWLKIGTSTQLALYNRDGKSVNFERAFAMNPFAVPYNEDGSIKLVPWPENSYYYNPLEALNVQDLDRTYRVLTSNYVNVDVPFIEGLSYKLNLGGSYRYQRQETYSGKDTKSGLEQNGVSEMDYGLGTDYTIENILKYDRTLGSHTIGLTALYSVQEREENEHGIEGIGFPSDTRTNFQHGAATVLTGSDSYSVTSNISQMARLNYSYNSTYLLTLTARRDGYSGFGSDTKFGVFPSIGLGWNMHRENFFPTIDQIDALKLRISYGKTGNQAIGAYSTLPGLSSAHYITETGLPAFGYYPSRIGDPTLGWETTKTFNVGLDFRLFNNRVQGSVDHYRSNTVDLLLNRNISNINGTGSIRQNIGETKNKGFELQISTININSGDFKWTSDFNISHYKNEIVDVSLRDEAGKPIDDVGNRWFIGKPINVNYAYKFGGIFQNEQQIFNSAQPDAKVGDVIVVDVNKDGIIDAEDRTLVGSRVPDYTLGFSNTFTYKNFTLSAMISAVQGVAKNNYFTRTYFNGNERSFNYKFWTPENPVNNYPANRDDANPRNVGIFGKANDASFIRLNDVSLSYSLPSTIMKKVNMSKVEIFTNAKNLVTITDWVGLDPEFNDQTAIPQSRTFIFGIRASF